MALLIKLLRFRDNVGRKEDESITYVLSNRAMFHIMEHMPMNKKELITKIKFLS